MPRSWAKKIFTNDDPGYIDLASPAGIGLGSAVLQLRRRRLRLRRGHGCWPRWGITPFRLGNLQGQLLCGASCSPRKLLEPNRQIPHAQRTDVQPPAPSSPTVARIPSSTTPPWVSFAGHKATVGVLPAQHGESSPRSCARGTRQSFHQRPPVAVGTVMMKLSRPEQNQAAWQDPIHPDVWRVCHPHENCAPTSPLFLPSPPTGSRQSHRTAPGSTSDPKPGR